MHNLISRRQFLKAGTLTVAAAGLTTCGLSTIAPDPDPSPVSLPSFTFGDPDMNNRVLVTYASYFGSTADVAATIGETLGANGITVDIKPINENPQINGYQAVLIGSAVQYATWLPEAVDFVKTNRQELSQLPVAFFSVHIQNTGGDEASRRNRLAYLDEVRPFAQPVSEGFFAGKFDRRGAALMIPGLIARFVPPLDFRKWKIIRAWAENVEPKLQAG